MNKIRVARFALISHRPYLAVAAMSLTLVETTAVPHMACDARWRLYYNPSWVSTQTVEALEAVLYHEILHLLREHHDRLKLYPQETANLAADAEINDDIRGEKMKLPEGAIYPDLFGESEGKPAEHYAEALMKQAQQGKSSSPQAGDSAGSGSPADGQPQADGEAKEQSDADPETCGGEDADSETADPEGRAGDDNMSPAEPATSGKPGKGKSLAEELNSQNPLDSGSAANGRKQAWELPDDDADSPGLSPDQGKVVIKQTAEAVQQAGNAPAYLKRWAGEKLIPPKRDWRKVLPAMVSGIIRRGYDDYTYGKIARKQNGVVLRPGMVENRPEVAIVVDTSGSISSSTLAEVVAGVGVIMQRAGGEVTVLSVDYEVHSVQRVTNIRQVELVGGGGTDMMTGIRHAEKLSPRPDIIIVVTDGDTDWGRKPAIPVIVALTNGDRNVPAWAKKVVIND